MRIRVWPADQQGCGHYRLIFPALALEQQGADVTTETTGPTVVWDRQWSGDAPPLDAEVLAVTKPDADVVVIQRPARRQWFRVIEELQRHDVKVVVDVDDAFHAIPRGNTAHRVYSPQFSPWHNHEWVARACGLADLVTVTTPALARVYGGHGRVAVLPNLVPERYLTLTGERDGATLGWSGSVETHPDDLEVTAGAAHRALLASGGRLKVVGTGAGVAERLRCEVAETTGWVDFADYPQAMASLDVGMVPLHSSPFNDAKSALKASEFASLGVPPVMSPSPDNLRLHSLGVGVVAGSPSQWRKHLTRLLTSLSLREDVAGRSREVMATQTYERNCERWLDAWSDAADRRVVAA